jgi:chromosome partitioning protein
MLPGPKNEGPTAFQKDPPDRSGHVICVASQKGGVGKTTTTVNLSTAIAVAEKSCLLVDCDPQGHATQVTASIHGNRKLTLYDAMVGKAGIRDVVVHTSIQFLHLLPANIELLQAEADLPKRARKESVLRSLLSELRRDYDYILIDTPPALGLLTVNGLVASDSLLVPLQCEFYAYTGLKPLLRFVALLREHLHPRLSIRGILLNMLRKDQWISQRIADQARSSMADLVFGTAIPWDPAILECAAHGNSILLQDMTSSSSRRYLDLAREVMGRLTVPSESTCTTPPISTETDGEGEHPMGPSSCVDEDWLTGTSIQERNIVR